MLKRLKRSIILFLSFVLAVSTIHISDFPYGKKVNASSLSTLYSNRIWERVAIEELGHGENTPFRKYMITDQDNDKNYRVMCGYSEGRGHPGDTYTKKVFDAKAWESAKDSALFGKNTAKIAKALVYYYDTVGVSNATEMQQSTVQVYIWAVSMGRDLSKALKQFKTSMKSLKKWKESEIDNIVTLINKQTVYGQVIVYSNKACNAGSNAEGTKLVHQPYYRWIAYSPEIEKTKATSTKELLPDAGLSVDITLHLIKTAEGAQLPGTTFSVDLELSNGEKFHKEVITDNNGKADVSFQTTNAGYIGETPFSVTSTSGEKSYIKNWSQLSEKQQKKYTEQGYYASYALAYAAAKAEADEKAEAELQRYIADMDVTVTGVWTVKELSSPGYYATGPITKSIFQEDIGVPVTLKFDNAPKIARIKLLKRSEETFNNRFSLKGAVYGIYSDSACNNIVASCITDENGEGIFEGILAEKNYYIKEIKAPAGFHIDTNVYNIKVNDTTGIANPSVPDGIIQVNEEPRRVSFAAMKQISDGETTTFEPGVSLKLTPDFLLSDGSSYQLPNEGISVTDRNGVAKWNDLLEGTYILEVVQGSEENPDAIKVGPYIISVNHAMENGIIDGQKMQVFQGDAMTDVEKGGYISVKKQSCYLDENGIRMYEEEEGAVFHIVKEENYSLYQQAEDKQPYIVSTLITDSSGFAKSTKLDATEEGNVYVLHQVSGKPYYQMSEDKRITIRSDADVFYSNNLVNYQKAIHVKIHKSVEEREHATDQLKGHPIPEGNVTFAILDASKITDLTALKKTKTKEEREKYISSGAYIASVRTDEGGNAYYEFPLGIHLPDGFILLQVDGSEKYEYLEPVFSTELRESFSKKEIYEGDDKTVNYGFQLKKETVDETDIYHLEAIDRETKKYAIAKVRKTMDTEDNNQVPEKNAVFSIYRFNDNYTGQDPGTFQINNNELLCGNAVVGTVIMQDGEAKSFTTDPDGEFYVPNLSCGEYIVFQRSGDEYHDKVSLKSDNIFTIRNGDCIFDEERMQDLMKGEFDKTRLTTEEQEIISRSQISLNDPLKKVVITLEKYSTHTNIKLNHAEYGLYRVTDEKKDGKVVVEKIKTLLTGYVPEEEREEDGSISPQIAEKYLGRDSASLEYGTYLLKETEAPFGYRITETFDDSEDSVVSYIEKRGEEYKDLTGKGKEIAFTIDSLHSTYNENGDIVYCNDNKEPEIFLFYNEQVRGRIGISKTGSVVTDFEENGGFIEGQEAIKGAVYALYAKEDIKDDSGKVFFKKGEEVDRKISNGSNVYFDMPEPYGEGTGRTRQLFMGEYEIKEIAAPKGYMVDQESYDISLSCEGGAKKVNPIKEREDTIEQEYETGSVISDRYYLIPGKDLNDVFKNIGYENISEIYFTHKTASVSSTRDVSAAKDGSVVLWQSGNSVFISTQMTEQEICFNYDCNYMFANLTALTGLYFMNVNTEYMAYAANMFYNCVNLQTLDISNFVTGNLTNSSRMFMGCEKLKTIYTGDEAQIYKSMDNEIIDLVVCPLYEAYIYYEPSDSSSEEEKDAMKFHVQDFSYYLQFSDGTMEEIQLADEDIAGIDPTYPNEIRDDFSVTMTIGDSGVEKLVEYAENKNYEWNEEFQSLLEHSGETPVKRNVTVKIIEGGNLNGKKLTEEYPEVVEELQDIPVRLELKIRKVGIDYVETLTNLGGDIKERLHALAECDPTPSVDNPEGQNTLDKFLFEISTASTFSVGDTIVPGGTRVAKIQTIDQKTDDGGDAGIDLPNGAYCNGDILYTIKEVEGQACYRLTDTQVKIPNIDFPNEPSDLDMKSYEEKLKELNPAPDVGFHASYDVTDGVITITIVYANEPMVMALKKNWDGADLDASVPDSIKVEVRETGTSQILQTITLKKEEGWQYTWNEDNLPIAGDNDITHYDFCEIMDGLSSDFEEPVAWKDETNHLVVLTNHLPQGSVKASVQKIWEDDNDTIEERPKSVKVHLCANSSVLKRYIPETINIDGETIENDIVLNEENNWTFETDENLSVTDAQGNVITWSWIEDPIANYYCSEETINEKQSDGNILYKTTLTNTYVLTSVTITKKIKGSDLNFHDTENVTFYFKLEGKTKDDIPYTKNTSVTFTRSMVEQMDDKEQYLEEIVQFNDVPFGTYTITEMAEEAFYECEDIMVKEGEGYANGIIKE